MEKSAPSVKWPLSLQYFFYFGVMGVVLPYFGNYCIRLGYNGSQVGALGAVRTMTVVVFAIFWSVVADRFNIRKQVYIFCNLMNAIICCLYLFTEAFWPIFLVTFSVSVFYGPIIAFLEAFTMDALGNEKDDKRKYGRIRVWGSFSFISIVIGLGFALDFMPVKTIVVIMVIGSFLQAATSIFIPAGSGHTPIKLSRKEMKAFFTPRMNIFLLCSFLMLLSHGTYYGFFTIHLEKLGYTWHFRGWCWGLASTLEILIMLNSDLLFKRFSLRSVLVFSFLAAAVRWIILFSCSGPVMILVSQCFHAMTYGAFHIACILYMDENSKKTKQFGQVINFAVSYGLGFALGVMFNGKLFDTWGQDLYMISTCIALVGAVIVYISERRYA